MPTGVKRPSSTSSPKGSGNKLMARDASEILTHTEQEYGKLQAENKQLKEELTNYYTGVDTHNAYLITKEAWESFNNLKQKLEKIKKWRKCYSDDPDGFMFCRDIANQLDEILDSTS